MNIEIVSQKVICSNEGSLHSYFAWPSVARLKDGRLAMVASGFRLAHICPFGKCIISYSSDEGQTWSLPAIVMDTPLDDRDGGITAFGESSVIVTSFNNNIEAQRNWSAWYHDSMTYRNSYLDLVEKKSDWEKYLGSTYRISHDNGVTFGELMKIPVGCPHGPAVMPDGTLLYVGRKFSADDSFRDETHLSCYKMYPDGTFEYLSEIENVCWENDNSENMCSDMQGLEREDLEQDCKKKADSELVSCEPHAIVLEDGKIIVHIRVQGGKGVFTIYQSESCDGGKTFTKPHRLLAENGGSPAHIIDDNGTLISTYGYRNAPYGIRAMFSKDGGETWDIDNVIVDNGDNGDLGYPSSVVLEDGSILTVFYAKPEGYSSAVIMQVIWRYAG